MTTTRTFDAVMAMLWIRALRQAGGDVDSIRTWDFPLTYRPKAKA